MFSVLAIAALPDPPLAFYIWLIAPVALASGAFIYFISEIIHARA